MNIKIRFSKQKRIQPEVMHWLSNVVQGTKITINEYDAGFELMNEEGDTLFFRHGDLVLMDRNENLNGRISGYVKDFVFDMNEEENTIDIPPAYISFNLADKECKTVAYDDTKTLSREIYKRYESERINPEIPYRKGDYEIDDKQYVFRMFFALKKNMDIEAISSFDAVQDYDDLEFINNYLECGNDNSPELNVDLPRYVPANDKIGVITKNSIGKYLSFYFKEDLEGKKNVAHICYENVARTVRMFKDNPLFSKKVIDECSKRLNLSEEESIRYVIETVSQILVMQCIGKILFNESSSAIREEHILSEWLSMMLTDANDQYVFEVLCRLSADYELQDGFWIHFSQSDVVKALEEWK